jgi:excisionase family DNA binding protein
VPGPHPLTYTVEQAAVALGIGRGLAYEMVRQGSLPSLRLGRRRIVIPRAGLESMLTMVPTSEAGRVTYAL